MKAVAVFPKGREVKVINVEEPRCSSPTQVKVRVLEVGVCGTDKEVVEFKHGRPPEGADYLIVGHEALGEVVEVGEAVRGLSPGDLVVPRVRRPCPHRACVPCRTGQTDFCVTGDYLERGIEGAHGFCAEFFVEEAHYLHVVPKELRGVAVLTEPLTIAEKALREVSAVQARLPWARLVPGHALVLGAGPVGLLGAMVMMRAGFRTTVYSRGAKPNAKAELSESMGAPYVSSDENSPEELVRQQGHVDVVYEAAGSPEAAFAIMEALGPNGVCILTGVPGGGGKLALDATELMKRWVLKNQVVLGTVNAAPVDFEAAVRDLEAFRKRWPGKLERILTARHPPEAFAEVVAGDKRSDIKDIITFTER
jgi:threonine dehydrogenase-like Zn-dependent dehydrogenase